MGNALGLLNRGLYEEKGKEKRRRKTSDFYTSDEDSEEDLLNSINATEINMATPLKHSTQWGLVGPPERANTDGIMGGLNSLAGQIIEQMQCDDDDDDDDSICGNEV